MRCVASAGTTSGRRSRKALGEVGCVLPSTSSRPSWERLSPPCVQLIIGMPYEPGMSSDVRTCPSFAWIVASTVSAPPLAGRATTRSGPVLPLGASNTPGPSCCANGAGPSAAAAGTATRPRTERASVSARRRVMPSLRGPTPERSATIECSTSRRGPGRLGPETNCAEIPETAAIRRPPIVGTKSH